MNKSIVYLTILHININYFTKFNFKIIHCFVLFLFLLGGVDLTFNSVLED